MIDITGLEEPIHIPGELEERITGIDEFAPTGSLLFKTKDGKEVEFVRRDMAEKMIYFAHTGR